MRRLLATLFVAVLATGCGSDTLGPVTTIDGQWAGLQNGYSMSFFVMQTDSLVTGTVAMGGVAGVAEGTVSGTFKYPAIDLKFSFDGSQDVSYKGTMSQAEAKIGGMLNGSGFVNLPFDVKKK